MRYIVRVQMGPSIHQISRVENAKTDVDLHRQCKRIARPTCAIMFGEGVVDSGVQKKTENAQYAMPCSWNLVEMLISSGAPSKVVTRRKKRKCDPGPQYIRKKDVKRVSSHYEYCRW